MLKWKPELIMNGLKIMYMKMEHLVFLDSVSFLPCPLRKLPEAFGLTACKSWYPLYFNTEENLGYVGPIPDVSYYGVNEMSEAERREFLIWYEGQKEAVFDNRRVLEAYCQNDVTVLRQECRVFKREFMQIGNIEVFLEAITFASACNKVLRKRFLKSDTVGLIPTGGYSGNVNSSKKALMWLVYREGAIRKGGSNSLILADEQVAALADCLPALRDSMCRRGPSRHQVREWQLSSSHPPEARLGQAVCGHGIHKLVTT